MSESSNIESTLSEDRHFPPPAEFAQQAHLKSVDGYKALHKRSIEDPEGFWTEEASNQYWFKPWDKVLEWNAPDAKWFVGGKANLCYNAVDRQVSEGHGDATAIIWEAEPMDERGEPIVTKLTYHDLMVETAKFANALKAKGVKQGDVVTIYMGMVPELAIATLACARIGAVHSVIFGGFSSQAIKDRVEDGDSKIIITCDGSYRRGKVVPLKDNVDEAAAQTDLVDTVIVYQRCNNDIAWTEGRDVWWRDAMNAVDDHCPCEEMDSEDLAFILYTSGSTGKPKGIMHTTGGYMVWAAMTSRLTFDLHAGDESEVYWCTADIGWITGHTYILYGILPNRVPTIMYEGAPNHPAPDRLWDMVERHKVTKFYTAPTAIRAFMKWGDEHPRKHNLSSLKVLGTVGEPINPEAWMWYHNEIGGGNCPIADTWWQTETGGHMLTPLPGVTTTTPGSCCQPMIGVDAAVVNSEGEEVGTNEGGILVIRKPWPGMLRGIYGDRDRYIDTYWSKFPIEKGYYVPADGARVDENGNFWIMGRIDDVIVVAGHNIGTMEVESTLVAEGTIAEAAVVGYPHDVKGNGIAAFCIPKGDTPAPGSDEAAALKKQLTAYCAKEMGAICKPDQIRFTQALPKTRSGKIMRRLLRDIAAGKEITSDVSTLEDKSIVEKLQASE
ncbi:MAG: acetate--CoA ligase [Phycisphaeraceae bacterium]|nr:acetate--CoA ligase [Phycisphaeraceae bacterium]